MAKAKRTQLALTSRQDDGRRENVAYQGRPVRQRAVGGDRRHNSEPSVCGARKGHAIAWNGDVPDRGQATGQDGQKAIRILLC